MNIDFVGALEAIARRWYVMVIALILGAGVGIAMSKHGHQYVANSAVILTSQADETQAGSTGSSPSGSSTVAAGLSMQPSDLPLLIQSENVLSGVASDMGSRSPVDVLRRQIKAHVGLQNDIMPIEFSAPSPEQAVQGANDVADELTRYYRTIATSRFSKLIIDLQRQIKVKQATLAGLDAGLEQTIARDPDVAAKEPSVMSAQFATLQSQRDQLAAAAKGDAEIATYGTRLTNETLPLAHQEIGNQDPAYVALHTQYAKDSAELARVKVAYSSLYPGLPELQDQVNREAQQVAAFQQRIGRATPLQSESYNQALKSQLQAQGQQLADQARIAQIDHQIESLRQTVTARMPSSVKAASLRRERDSADAALSALQARLAEADADRAVAGSLGSIAVISRAASASLSTWSKPKVVIIGALVAAFWFALALIALLEHFDRRLQSRRQIEAAYGVPMIATVGAALHGARYGNEGYLGLRA
jgi:capsular polysaccharide biosynthesis protein